MMSVNKRQIKIVKQSAKKIAAETSNEPEVVDSSLKDAQLVKRKITTTITGWITEQREVRRYAEIVARDLLVPVYS